MPMRTMALTLFFIMAASATSAQTLEQKRQDQACRAQWEILNKAGQPGLANRAAFLKTCRADVNSAVVLPNDADMQAPAGATGVCKDGSYTAETKREGACAHHGGLSRWLP